MSGTNSFHSSGKLYLENNVWSNKFQIIIASPCGISNGIPVNKQLFIINFYMHSANHKIAPDTDNRHRSMRFQFSNNVMFKAHGRLIVKLMNIYNGIVKLDDTGEAMVEMPVWFEALNSDYRYQLTSLGTASPNLHISEKISDLRFKIAGGLPGQEVSWQVTGIRQDAFARTYRIPIEEDKNEQEKGKYLHPELFGKTEEFKAHS